MVVPMLMIVVVVVMPGAGRVRTGLGIERRFNRLNVPAETFDHVLDHMIGANADPVAEQLHRQMAIAQMPRDPHKFAIIVRVNFQQRLRPGADADYASPLQRQPIPIAQPHSLGEVDQHFPPSFRCQNDTAAMAAVEVDQHLIGRVGPGAGGENGRRADQ
jgi:hypothetical protein